MVWRVFWYLVRDLGGRGVVSYEKPSPKTQVVCGPPWGRGFTGCSGVLYPNFGWKVGQSGASCPRWNVSMIMRQLVLEFREQNTALVGLVQRLLHGSQVLGRVKGSLRSPCGRP